MAAAASKLSDLVARLKWLEVPPSAAKKGHKAGRLSIVLEGNTALARAAKEGKQNEQTAHVFEDGSVADVLFFIQTSATGSAYIWIGGFYARIQQDIVFAQAVVTIGTSLEKTMLKGIGHSALCLLIDELWRLKLVSPKTQIALEASGIKLSKFKSGGVNAGLILYYFSIGFQYPSNPAEFYLQLGRTDIATELIHAKSHLLSWQEFLAKENYVPLTTTVQQYLFICTKIKKHQFQL
jgi:hypothetical protein